MKKIIFAIAFTLGLNAVFAQSNAANRKDLPPDVRAEKASQRWAKDLALSAEQTGKIKTAILTRITNMNALKAKNVTDKKAFHAEAKTIKETFYSEIKTILSAEQLQKFEAQKAAMKQKHKDKKQGNTTGAGSGNLDDID